MSQSIRISSGLGGPILQHVPNTSSSSCMFLRTEVGFPIINLSLKETECRKRAWVVSNRNHPRFPYLIPCAATLKSSSSNVDLDDGEDGSKGSNKGKCDDDGPLNVVLFRFSQAWLTIFLNLHSFFRHMSSKFGRKVNKGVVTAMIYMDLHDPIDGLKVLLDVSETWRMILSLNGDLYDGKGFDGYGESYHRKARMEGGKLREGKNHPLKLTKSKLFTLRMLADLDDPFDGLEALLEALEFWRTVYSSKRDRLNDSEGYLQKEIFALRDLSQRVRISVSNRNGKNDEAKYDEAKNPPLLITQVLALFKFKMDNFQDPSYIVEAMQEYFRSVSEKEKTSLHGPGGGDADPRAKASLFQTDVGDRGLVLNCN